LAAAVGLEMKEEGRPMVRRKLPHLRRMSAEMRQKITASFYAEILIVFKIKKNWMEGITKAMNERNINEGQWEDWKQWSLGVRQRRTTF